MNQSINHKFTFKLTTMPPIDSELRWAISKVNGKWSGLTLQGTGKYEQLVELHLALTKAIGIRNVELLEIEVCESDSKPEELPRAIGLSDLSQPNKEIVVFSMMAATCGADVLAHLLNCSREEAAEQIQMLVGEKFGQMSDEDVNNAIAAVEEQERTKSDNKIVFVKI